MKSKADKLDIGKLETIPIDLSKISDAVKKDVVKKDVYNAQIKNVGAKIPDITNLATTTTFNVEISKFKSEIRSMTNLVTTTALTAVGSKTLDNSKYITTPELNKLTAKTFAARLAPAI